MKKMIQSYRVFFIASALFCASSAHAAPVNPGYADYEWLFDSASGTNATATVGGINGTLENGATFSNTATPFAYAGNHAVTLDGSDDNINFTTHSGFQYVDATFTYSVWVKSPGKAGRMMLLTKSTSNGSSGLDEAYQTEIYNQNPDLTRLAGGPVVSQTTGYYNWEPAQNTTITNDAWHHVAMILTTDETGPVARIFMDGVELTTTNIQNNMVNGTYLGAATIPLRLGARSTTGGGIDSTYLGVLDELAIYNRALSNDEILWLSQNSLAAIPEPASAALFTIGAILIARRKK